MKIISLNTKTVYDIDVTRSGENHMPCPECSQTRKKTKAKSFSWNNQIMKGYCQHCLTAFVEYNTVFKKKEYVLPQIVNYTDLSDKILSYFEKRGIFQETIKKMGIYETTEYMPQVEKETTVICFPYFKDDKLINVKYRDNQKNFKLVKDAELIFYNINALKDNDSIVIVEGEFDCLSYIQAGITNVISVPNGASATNLEYLDSSMDLFTGKTVYISTDNDIKGYELRNEFIRRFGQENCKLIELEDCKDANEFIVKYGTQELKKKYETAKDFPVHDIIDVDDNYDDCYNLYMNGMEKGKGIGMSDIDNIITWERGRVVVVTGIPGHGKSELVDFIAINLCLTYGWKIGYFSPENYPFKYHFSKLASKLIGKSFDSKYMNKLEFDMAHQYISDNVGFIYPVDDMTFENILSKAEYLVKKKGISQFIIDPYNKIEHLRKSSESETEYISRFLDRCTTFAKKYNVLLFIVAHPRKMNKNKDDSSFEIPTLYDINGSANFYNKCDYGLTVYRDYQKEQIRVLVSKVKFKHLGVGGDAVIKYNFINGRFENIYTEIDNYNNSSFIGVRNIDNVAPVNIGQNELIF